jgi:hypothetical protein
MADILANPVDICFGSMPAKAITLAACLVIEGNVVTADQHIGTDLLTKTHPPTPSDLIAGIDRFEGIVVWTSLGPLPRWVPGPTTRWAPGTTRLALHGT